ncbi:hypothetical protein ACVWXR_002353 [Pseudomonas lurida]
MFKVFFSGITLTSDCLFKSICSAIISSFKLDMLRLRRVS